MRQIHHQHSIFTKRQDAEDFVEMLIEDIAADESLEIIPDAAGAKFIVSLKADGQHQMYV